MFQLDPMLDGGIARERQQGITQQIQHYELTRKIKSAKGNHKATVPLRVILVAVINSIITSF